MGGVAKHDGLGNLATQVCLFRISLQKDPGRCKQEVCAMITKSLGRFSRLLTGCQAMPYGTAADIAKIPLGITKAEVVQILGAPVSVGAAGDKEKTA